MPPSDAPTFHIRLSPALMKRIRIAAAENERSVNAEIATRLERTFAGNEEDRQQARTLLAEAISILDKGSR